jgi:hypothetical protein
MEHEGILIEVGHGRVIRVLSNGVPLPAGAAVTYDGADPRLLQVSEPTQAEQIDRIIVALREGRANTQRHGIRTACEKASGHYQAVAQATAALAELLSDVSDTTDGDPTALLTRVQEAVNRIHDDVLGEVRQQLLVACAQAIELRFDVEEEKRQPPPPRSVDRKVDEAIRQDDAVDINGFAEQLRRAYQG